MPASKPGVTAPKTISYRTEEPYHTFGRRTGRTRTVWVAFHGIGYLARYFLKHFHHLDPERNYVLAPQAPSLYYLSDAYTHVGACWLTRERTAASMENLLRYLDALYEAEDLAGAGDLRLFGYSQGVSVLCRWVARRQVSCQGIQLYAGRVPDELTAEHFAHLPPGTPVELLWGDQDPYLKKMDTDALLARARELFGERLRITRYKGGHELQPQWIAQ